MLRARRFAFVFLALLLADGASAAAAEQAGQKSVVAVGERSNSRANSTLRLCADCRSNASGDLCWR